MWLRVEGLGPAEAPPPLSQPLFVPDVNPEPQPLFCRLQGQGVTASLAGAADRPPGLRERAWLLLASLQTWHPYYFRRDGVVVAGVRREGVVALGVMAWLLLVLPIGRPGCAGMARI